MQKVELLILGFWKDAPFQYKYQYMLASKKRIVDATTTTVPKVVVRSGDEG